MLLCAIEGSNHSKPTFESKYCGVFITLCAFTSVLDKHSVRFLGHYERQRGKVTKPTGRVVGGAKSDHNLEIFYTEEIQKQRYEKI